MSLERVWCRGFRAFSERTELELRKITVVFGRNNSGKTTLSRLPLFALASLASERGFVLSANEIAFGGNFRELATADQAHPSVSFGVAWADEHDLGIELQLLTSGSVEYVQIADLEMDSIHYPMQYSLLAGELHVDSALTRLDASAQKDLLRHRQELRRLSAGCIHIASARPAIASIYEAREAASWSIREAPYHLLQDRSLLQAVDGWFRQELDGLSIDLDRANLAFRMLATEADRTVNLASAGRGTQSTLGLATLLKAVELRKLEPTIIAVEEPEAHLHPSAHGALADLAVAASSNCPVLVETHSENFVLRLRRRVAEGRLNNADVNLYYVDHDHSVRKIHIDETGGVSGWPTGVFEADVDEAQAILAAKLAVLDATSLQQ